MEYKRYAPEKRERCTRKNSVLSTRVRDRERGVVVAAVATGQFSVRKWESAAVDCCVDD